MTSFKRWIADVDPKALDLWKEAMANLRQLHGDVWNGVKFFLTTNGIIMAAMGVFLTQGNPEVNLWAVVFLALVGVYITYQAKCILIGHRNYYLTMLVLKSLLEEELGMYDVDLGGINLSFPWNVEKRFLPCIRSSREDWMNEQRWRRHPKTLISTRLYDVYNGVLLLHAVVIIGVLIYWVMLLLRGA